ncbi:MAG: response regulator [Deltaproteobacteria bacterium]|jgi:putative two-component system response regulator|nr:response regulator [Deltaproteobacteria bacterium]
MKRILVVDDNLATLQQINAQLEENYEVVPAKSGAQALKVCSAVKVTVDGREETIPPPDLILLDLDMPDMDGFETMANIKKNMALRHIPVIFLTSTHNTEVEVKALKNGAVDFITKPAEKDILQHRIGVHLNLSDYHRELESKVRYLEDSIIASFSDMIEYRDEETGGHVTRTAAYVELLGLELVLREQFQDELNPFTVDLMKRAAPLHDVGKIAIPDVIMLKPGLLNDDEFSLMKTHTTKGAEMLRKIFARVQSQPYHNIAVSIAQSHHERWDGKGYPHQLKGEEIPLCARLMAVADVFDALIDKRVYKRAMSHDDACRIIISEKEHMFDPVIIEAFEGIHDRLANFKHSKTAN